MVIMPQHQDTRLLDASQLQKSPQTHYSGPSGASYETRNQPDGTNRQQTGQHQCST